MDAVGAALLGRRQHLVLVEIAFARRRGAQAHGVVGLDHERRVRVGVGIDRHRVHAQAAGGADDAAGDLAPVGDEKALDHHMRNTPKRASGIGALSEAASARPSTSRVWAGSMIPSSHSRPVA